MQKQYIEQSKKKLIIIQKINYDILKNLDHNNTDFLCIDIDSMLKLKKLGFPFLSLYDFYNRTDFLDNLKDKLETLKEIFERLDSKYAPIINYPRAFMGNYYEFLVDFADFLFISEVVAKLQNKYQSVSLYTCYKKEDLEYYKRHKSINFFNKFNIIDNRDILIAEILHKGLNADLIYSKPDDEVQKINKLSLYMSILKYSNYSILSSYLSLIKNRISIKKNKNNKTIFAINLYYEPRYLLPYMNEYNFVNPVELIQKFKLDKKHNLPDFLEPETTAIKDLTTLKGDIFLELLRIYQRDIISFIPSLIEGINITINKYEPLCVFFSIGQVDILENIVAFLANKNKIPVFNFQHGDGIEFLPDIFEFNRYIELNENIRKILILRSRKQYDILNKIKPFNTELFYGGSCKVFTYINKLPKKKSRNNGKVLVIIGHYPADAYKNLVNIETDNEIFDKHNQMFKIFKKYNVEVDIKLFPNNKHLNYFKEMVRYYDLNTSKVITQPNVDFLLPNYDMIIMEYIGSALTPLLIALKLPIIYWINKSFINQNVLDDFCRRHYLITNETEFEEVIKQFKDNKLDPKYDEELIKTYCYPSCIINPAQNIAEYIKNKSTKF